ncbi:hypothetical protein CP532_0081 [Ophiocordyceps camponoti-leonardi (nom. inval.)]|nr:hypothetical protein CP532_0081 [Ophiocordyceps camponoti-leonardi (nom. inval.)]
MATKHGRDAHRHYGSVVAETTLTCRRGFGTATACSGHRVIFTPGVWSGRRAAVVPCVRSGSRTVGVAFHGSDRRTAVISRTFGIAFQRSNRRTAVVSCAGCGQRTLFFQRTGTGCSQRSLTIGSGLRTLVVPYDRPAAHPKPVQQVDKTQYGKVDWQRTQKLAELGPLHPLHIGPFKEKDGKLLNSKGQAMPTSIHAIDLDDPDSRWYQQDLMTGAWNPYKVQKGKVIIDGSPVASGTLKPNIKTELPLTQEPTAVFYGRAGNLVDGRGNALPTKVTHVDIKDPRSRWYQRDELGDWHKWKIVDGKAWRTHEPINVRPIRKQVEKVYFEKDGRLFDDKAEPLPMSMHEVNLRDPGSRWWTKNGLLWYRNKMTENGPLYNELEPVLAFSPPVGFARGRTWKPEENPEPRPVRFSSLVPTRQQASRLDRLSELLSNSKKQQVPEERPRPAAGSSTGLDPQQRGPVPKQPQQGPAPQQGPTTQQQGPKPQQGPKRSLLSRLFNKKQEQGSQEEKPKASGSSQGKEEEKEEGTRQREPQPGPSAASGAKERSATGGEPGSHAATGTKERPSQEEKPEGESGVIDWLKGLAGGGKGSTELLNAWF